MFRLCVIGVRELVTVGTLIPQLSIYLCLRAPVSRWIPRQSSEWAPHTAEVLQMSDGVCGSAFPLGAATGETVWTLINRNNTARGGAQLLPLVQGTTSRPLHFFDCYRGVPLTPNGEGELSFTIAANGFGCVLATPTATVISPPPSAEALRLTGGAPAVPRRCLRHSATFSPPWHR